MNNEYQKGWFKQQYPGFNYDAPKKNENIKIDYSKINYNDYCQNNHIDKNKYYYYGENGYYNYKHAASRCRPRRCIPG